MILLPRGNPVKERLNPARVQLAEALQKLKQGGFSGYLRFLDPAAEGIVIFADGRLISALFAGGQTRLTGEAALRRIFALALEGRSTIDTYRLSSELAESVHALLHGDVLHRGQELKLIDVKGLLARLKTERISGCLRIYTAERVALIFYRDGTPLGFFHDGASQIETSADTSMSVARLPGAKIDVLTIRCTEEAPPVDLMTSLDVPALWQEAQQRSAVARRERQEEERRGRARQAAHPAEAAAPPRGTAPPLETAPQGRLDARPHRDAFADYRRLAGVLARQQDARGFLPAREQCARTMQRRFFVARAAVAGLQTPIHPARPKTRTTQTQRCRDDLTRSVAAKIPGR